MKILMLSQFYPPVVGGEERHVLNLSAGLAAAGHDVHVATLRLDARGPVREVQEDGVVVHRLDHVGPHISWAYQSAQRPLALPIPDPITARALADLIEKLRLDVLHAHNWIVNSALRASVSGKVPLVLTLHDYSHVCATKRLMRHDRPCPGPTPRRCLPCTTEHYDIVRGPLIYGALRAGVQRRERRIAQFVSVSQYVADHSELHRIAHKSTVVPNFIPDEMVGAPLLARDPGLPTGDYVFYAGDLSRQKGVHTLLEAHRALGADAPDLMLVGRRADAFDGPLAGNVRVGTEWDHARVVSGFQHCAVAVLPSEWPDPCPTTVLEAMALGAPLVTTEMGGIASLVEPGLSALTVPPGDAEALTCAMSSVLRDEALRERLRTAGRVRAARFTRSAVVRSFEEIYVEVIREITP